MPYLLAQIFLFLLLALLIGVAIGMWMGRRHGTRRIAILEAQVRDLVADLDACRQSALGAGVHGEGEVAEQAQVVGPEQSERRRAHLSGSAEAAGSSPAQTERLSQEVAAGVPGEAAADASDSSAGPEEATQDEGSTEPHAHANAPATGEAETVDAKNDNVADDPLEGGVLQDAGELTAAAVASRVGIAKFSAGHSDDLKQLWGIGPRMEAFLNDAGIHSFSQIAGATQEQLRAVLDASGIKRLVDIANEETWPDQAALAARGDWDALKEYQSRLSWKTGGKPA